MMMPARPMAHLIIRQAGFTLTALKAFFNALFGLGYAGKVGQRGLGSSIGEVKVDFHSLVLVAVSIANHHRHLPMALLALRRAGHHRAFHALDDQRTFGPIAHVDGCPGLRGQRGAPLIEALPGTLWTPAPTAGGRWRGRQVTYQCVARNRQQIALAQTIESATKPIRPPHLVVPREPRVRQMHTV